jgi:hypothetical protein
MARKLALLCLALMPGAALAQTPQPAPPAVPAAVDTARPAARHFEVHRATSDIRVDGVLDEKAWADALTYDISYEWSPGENVPPPVQTEFLVTYDDRNLYAAWRCHDPKPAEIRAHLMDRDSIDTFVQDDHVVLMIDPFNDERRGFQFRINPLGVQADAVFSENEGIEDWSFDMIWASAGKIGPDGYVVEIAIPLNQIRFPRASGAQTWGFDTGRSYPRNVRHRIASWPHDRNNRCLLCQIDKVSGFENLKPGLNLELDPTVTANRTDAVDSFPGDLQTGHGKIDPGLSARWGVTPNASLNATINPDFSQVEADVAQLAVNERFALFFPEKRPFFLEGVDYFATPLDAVFTRTVVDPNWGLKLTGKEGRNALGLFVDQDHVNSFLIPSNQRSGSVFLNEKVDGGVLRYRRDVGRASTVGLLVTDRESDDYHNRVAGFDSYLRLNPSDTIKIQALRSDTLYPSTVAQRFGQSAGAFDGNAVMVDYNHAARDWFWDVSYSDLGAGFRADSGFIPRVDIRETQAQVQHQTFGERDDWYNQINVGSLFDRVEDHSGRLTDQKVGLYANVTGPLQSFAETGVRRDEILFEGVRYDGLVHGWFSGNLQPSGAARLALSSEWGETIDVQNNRHADFVLLSPSAEIKLGSHVNTQLSDTIQRLDVRGGRLFTANLSQLRLVYNFNVRMFVRGIFQYLDLEQDPALFTFPVDPKTRTLFTQLLFSYKLNPQTVLFLGYSDNHLGLQDISLTQTDRTFFFKIGYAWVI